MGKKKVRPPVPSEFAFEHDGEPLELSKYAHKVTTKTHGFMVSRFDFELCPICLNPDPRSEEHVPPGSLGGRVMCLTCGRCNNDFGTAENELRRFISLETTAHVEATDGSVKGHRAAEVALRSAAGRPAGAFIRSAAPEVESILNKGSSNLTIRHLDMTLVTAAALKHSYLAACLVQREVPDTPGVKRARTVLLAARDRDRSALVDALNSLAANGDAPHVGWVENPGTQPIFLFARKGGNGSRWLFMLGGRFTLPWPFQDVEPLPASAPPSPAAADSEAKPDAEPIGE